jgi:hypothetical protein
VVTFFGHYAVQGHKLIATSQRNVLLPYAGPQVHVDPPEPNSVTLKMEAAHSSETSELTCDLPPCNNPRYYY